MNMKSTLTVLLTVVVCCSLWTAGCRRVERICPWRDREIVIDGENSEWKHGLVHFDDRAHAAIAMYNDDRFLYLCLSTKDRITRMQTALRGITLWFDPEGGTQQAIGLRYPPGSETDGDDDAVARILAGREPRSAEDSTSVNDSFLNEASLENMEISGPGEENRRTVPIDEARKLGIEICMKENGAVMIYELKLPLEFCGVRTGENGDSFSALGMCIESQAVDKKIEMKKEAEMRQRSGTRAADYSSRSRSGPQVRGDIIRMSEGWSVRMKLRLSPGPAQ